MTSKVFFATDEDKILNSAGNILDRVINLKINTEKESFVIRSDYEPVHPSLDYDKLMASGNIVDRRCYFRKCQHKPSIKVQYNQVSGGTTVSLDIFITNFFMVDTSGNCLMEFNNGKNPIKSVEIMMGYFGQFKDTFNVETGTMQDYFNFQPTDLIDKIVMSNAQYVTIDTMPPNYTMHIHGFVGSVINEPKLVENVNNAKFGSKKEIDISSMTIGDILKTLITDRFTFSARNENVNIEKPVEVHISETLSKKKLNGDILDADGNKVPLKFTVDDGNTLKGTMSQIQKVLDKDIMMKQKNDGSILVYSVDDLSSKEGIRQLSKVASEDLTNAILKNEGNLPAVKNINIGATSLIVCPYFGFLDPFQNFKFKSRYSLTSLVTYYASVPLAFYEFFALNVSVSFATVEDVNEMQIKAITLGV